MASEDSGSESKSNENTRGKDAKKIPLRMVDQDGTTLVFKVKVNTTFKKILDAFAHNVGKSSSEFRLLLHGKNVDLVKTPDDFGLEGGEELEVVTSQVGG